MLYSIQVSNIKNKNRIEWLSGLAVNNILSIYRFYNKISEVNSHEILESYKELEAALDHLPAFTLRIPKDSAEFIVDRLTKLSHPWNRFTIV
jgi:hypothetical protein